MSAILEKTYTYLISERSETTDAVLVGDELYVLDVYDEEGEQWYELRHIDLNAANGRDGLVKLSKKWKPNISRRYARLIMCDDVVIVQGASGLVFDRCTFEVLFSEDDMRIDVWEPSSFSFIYNDLYYRRRQAMKSIDGIDVVNMKTPSIVGHLNCDIGGWALPYKGVLYGERANGNFALYSLSDEAYLLELDSEKYGEVQGRGLRYCLDDGFIYLLCGGYVLVVDVESRALVREIKYVSDPMLHALIDKDGRRPVGVDIAALISVCGGVVVLSNYGVINGWVGMIDINFSDAFAWVVQGREVKIANAQGDLIYGVEGKFPVAYDKYSGKMVWSAMKVALSNEIYVGTSWVVYFFIRGKMQCFKMKKQTYHSPAHPEL